MEKNNVNILFDYGRTARIGLPEAVFCEKKPLPTLVDLLEKFACGEPPILFTRLMPEIVKDIPSVLLAKYDYDPLSATAFASVMPRRKGKVGIISAGAADARVSHECARTLTYLGIASQIFEDCGISALWRVMDRLEEINSQDALIVIAGMEGALPSVVGGLTPKPVFAVPTSVGYGVSVHGYAALCAMLASCAPGIAVLNIDNGYGAACAAARVAGLL